MTRSGNKLRIVVPSRGLVHSGSELRRPDVYGIHGRKACDQARGFTMDSQKRSRLVALMATLTLIFAVTAPAALAQSGGDGYRTDGPSVLGQTEGGGGNDDNGGNGGNGSDPSNGEGTTAGNDTRSADRSASSGDSLPFTGLDLGLVAAAGASLMLMGVGMRRLTRAPDSV